MNRASSEAGQAIMDSFDNGAVKSVMKIRLPFQVEDNPVSLDGVFDGIEFIMYNHEHDVYMNFDQEYYVLIVYLHSKDKPYHMSPITIHIVS